MVSPPTSEVQPTMGVKIFSAGISACLADIITFPLDTAKVRLQVEFSGADEASPSTATAVGDPVMCAVLQPLFLRVALSWGWVLSERKWDLFLILAEEPRVMG